MFALADRIFETSVTAGLGTYTLDGAQPGFQAFSVIGANNECTYFATDDTFWEVGIGKYLSAPNRLTRETILASSNAGAAVNWGGQTIKLRCSVPAAGITAKRRLSKSVAGGANVALTQDEQRRDILEFTGALTANIDVTVDATVWTWVAFNNTTGPYKLTLKVAGQTGVQLEQGRETTAYCNGTDVALSQRHSFRKNAIINGDFNVWQRGTSFAAIATTAYHADRWRNATSGAMVFTASRSTDVPTVAQAGRLFNYSLLFDCTTADAAIAAGDIAVIDQRIEGYNWLPLAQRAFTFSFWVKATKTGTYCVAFINSGNDRSYVAEYTINAADTWERKTVTVSASPSAGTWDYTTGIGLQVNFTLAAGSTFQTTANAWQTGQFFATANQVNACDNVANDFRIAGVQLEAGSVATESEQRTINDETALCQRYYFRTGVMHFPWLSAHTAIGGLGWTVYYPVEMRVSPSATIYDAFTLTNCTQSGVTSLNTIKADYTVDTAAANAIRADNGAIEFSAEL